MKNLKSSVIAAMVMVNALSAYASGVVVQNFGTAAGKDSVVEGSTRGVVSRPSTTPVVRPILIPQVEGVFETYAKVGNAQTLVGGVVYVENNATNPLGSTGAYCRGVASTTGASAKISPIVNYAGSAEFYTSFKVIFGADGGSDTGKWQFGQGRNTDGTQFQSGDVVGNRGFAVVMFTLTTDDSVRISYRSGTTGNSNATAGLLRRSLKQGVVYNVELIGNNRSGSSNITYDYNGTPRTLSPQKFDLYRW